MLYEIEKETPGKCFSYPSMIYMLYLLEVIWQSDSNKYSTHNMHYVI